MPNNGSLMVIFSFLKQTENYYFFFVNAFQENKICAGADFYIQVHANMPFHKQILPYIKYIFAFLNKHMQIMP